MLNKLKEFFDSEYKSTKRWIETPYGKPYKKEAIKNALQRGLGAALFIQTIAANIEYKKVNELYEDYKEKIERLDN